jgi:methionine sulfoxide reductase heme-binding subunit
LKKIVLIKRVIFVAALIPFARLLLGWFPLLEPSLASDLSARIGLSFPRLAADPIADTLNFTGDWAIAFVIISLGVTPLRRVSGWNEAIKLRRMLGLFGFFYATCHMLTWIAIDKGFDVSWMIDDIIKRKFITVGMATWIMLLALAITSTTGWIRRLGGRRWQQLHRLAYVAGVGAVIHFSQLVKADETVPIRWAVVLTIFFGVRIWWVLRKRRRALAQLLPS